MALHALEHQLAESRRQYDALLEKYHALVQPAQLPMPGAPPRDAVMEAINAAAGVDHRLRGIMARQVMTDRAQGLTDTEIIARIRQGNTVAESMTS